MSSLPAWIPACTTNSPQGIPRLHKLLSPEVFVLGVHDHELVLGSCLGQGNEMKIFARVPFITGSSVTTSQA